jgi:hypothetical protein
MATIPLLEEDATPNSTSVGPRRQRRARALAQLFGAALCCCALAGRAWLTRESRSGADAAVRVLASTPAERAAAASRACELASLVENGPPLPHDPSPPPTLTESFALTLDTGLDRYDARAAAARLSAAFGVKAEQLSAVASAAAGGRVRLDVDVTHARHDALSALGTLNALKPAALDAAAGAMVLRGRPFCVSLLHVNDQHSRVEPVNAALSTWGSAADRAANATKVRARARASGRRAWSEARAGDGCAHPPPPSPPNAHSPTRELICVPSALLHAAQYGGAPLVWGALSARAAALRAAGRHALVVNAGDEFQGSPFFNYYGGNLTADILKAAGLLDLLALGNHEVRAAGCLRTGMQRAAAAGGRLQFEKRSGWVSTMAAFSPSGPTDASDTIPSRPPARDARGASSTSARPASRASFRGSTVPSRSARTTLTSRASRRSPSPSLRASSGRTATSSSTLRTRTGRRPARRCGSRSSASPPPARRSRRAPASSCASASRSPRSAISCRGSARATRRRAARRSTTWWSSRTSAWSRTSSSRRPCPA